MERLPLARWLLGLPIAAGGCLVTSSLDELEGAPPVCESGHFDCDGVPDNGCEVDLETDPASCGVCGTACPSAPSAAPACIAASCTIACDLFTGNCDGNDANGCETPVEKDSNNCGKCGNACGSDNTVSSACVDGVCAMQCVDGYATCDGVDGTGCEANLTSAAHCGLCDRTCPASECASQSCAVSALLDNSTALAVSDGSVYVAVYEANCTATPCTYIRQLRSVPVTGGGVADLFDPMSRITDIAVHPSGTLYLATGSSIQKYAPGDATPSLFVSSNSDAIEVDATHVYHLENDGVERSSLADGTTTLLAEVESKGGNSSALLALAGTTLYFSGESEAGEGLHAVAAAGGTAALLVEGDVETLASDATAAYFTLQAAPATLQRARDGTVEVLLTTASTPSALVTDGTVLVWWSQGAGALLSANADGSSVTTLFQGTPGAARVAVDSEAMYWLTSLGQLNRLRR